MATAAAIAKSISPIRNITGSPGYGPVQASTPRYTQDSFFNPNVTTPNQSFGGNVSRYGRNLSSAYERISMQVFGANRGGSPGNNTTVKTTYGLPERGSLNGGSGAQRAAVASTQTESGDQKSKGGNASSSGGFGKISGRGAIAGTYLAGQAIAATGGIATTAMNNKTQTQMQDTRINNFWQYNKQHQQALTTAGLPTYLAFGTPNFTPHTTQVSSGMNHTTSHLPGNPTSSIFTGTGSQMGAGWGNVM
jgi:hypothetical protein